MPQATSKKTTGTSDTLFQSLPSPVPFFKAWKKAKVITLPKPDNNQKSPQNLHPISLLSTRGKLFEKVILKTVQSHIDKRGLLNASELGFGARHSTTIQCMRLSDHSNLNFNSNMSTAPVFLDIEKAFDTKWHLGLLYKLSDLKFSISLIKLIICFLSRSKFRLLVEGKISIPRDIKAGVPQGSILSPTLYSMYINDTPQTPNVYLGHFADDTCIYATERKSITFSASCSEVSLLQRRGVSAETLKSTNIRLKSFTFLIDLGPLRLILNGQNIPFLNHVKYLDVISHKKIIWRLRIETIETKAFRTFIRIYNLFKSERLSANIKLTLHNALMRAEVTY
jgi:hypothetical protein